MALFVSPKNFSIFFSTVLIKQKSKLKFEHSAAKIKIHEVIKKMRAVNSSTDLFLTEANHSFELYFELELEVKKRMAVIMISYD